MSFKLPRGKILGPEDLSIALTDANGCPTDVYSITYAIYDVSTGVEVLLGPAQRVPVRRELGYYYASIKIPEDANLGLYRIRWTFQETLGSPTNTVFEDFTIANPEVFLEDLYTPIQADMLRRLRILLRDNCLGAEEVVEISVDGDIMEVTLLELWELLHEETSP